MVSLMYGSINSAMIFRHTLKTHIISILFSFPLLQSQRLPFRLFLSIPNHFVRKYLKSLMDLKKSSKFSQGLNGGIFLSTPTKLRFPIHVKRICSSGLSFPSVQPCQVIRFRRVLPAGLRLYSSHILELLLQSVLQQTGLGSIPEFTEHRSFWL